MCIGRIYFRIQYVDLLHSSSIEWMQFDWKNKFMHLQYSQAWVFASLFISIFSHMSLPLPIFISSYLLILYCIYCIYMWLWRNFINMFILHFTRLSIYKSYKFFVSFLVKRERSGMCFLFQSTHRMWINYVALMSISLSINSRKYVDQNYTYEKIFVLSLRWQDVWI